MDFRKQREFKVLTCCSHNFQRHRDTPLQCIIPSDGETKCWINKALLLLTSTQYSQFRQTYCSKRTERPSHRKRDSHLPQSLHRAKQHNTDHDIRNQKRRRSTRRKSRPTPNEQSRTFSHPSQQNSRDTPHLTLISSTLTDRTTNSYHLQMPPPQFPHQARVSCIPRRSF